MHINTCNKQFIRTFEDNLYRRLDGLKQERKELTKHISSILTKYNITEHSTIEIKPVGAVKSENRLWVNLHLQNAAKKNRPYEKIKQGDLVIIIIKNSFDKARMPNWSSEQYKDLGTDDNNFVLNHPT